MEKLKKNYVIFLVDISPDSGDVSQMKPVAYVDEEYFAKEISKFLSSIDNGGDGSRAYKWTELNF